MQLPVDLITRKTGFVPTTNVIADLQDRMRLVHEVDKNKIGKRRNLIKERYDHKASANTACSVRDLVMSRNPVIQNHETRKFHLPCC